MSELLARHSSLVTVKRLFSLTRKFWPWYLLVFVMSFLAAPLALLGPLPLSIVADFVISGVPTQGTWLDVLPAFITDSRDGILLFAVALLLLTTLLTQMDSYGNWLLQTYLGERTALFLKEKLLGHILRLPLIRHRTLHSAESMYRLQSDIPAVTYIPIQWIIMTNAAFSIAAMVYVIAKLNLCIAALALMVTPFIYILLKVYEPRARYGWATFKAGEAGFLGFLKETIGAALPIKSYGVEQYSTQEAARIGRQVLRQEMRAIGIESLFGGAIALLLAMGAAVILFVGTQAVLATTLSLGNLILIMGYLVQLYKPLETLAKKTANLQSAYASADRVFAILDDKVDEAYHLPPLMPEAAPSPIKGEIEFKGVSFSYNSDQQLINQLDLRIPARGQIGIVGRSGIGKSTFIHLLRGLISPDAGEILLDGISIQTYANADLCRLISVVFQDSILLSGSIRDNIAFGLSDVPLELIKSAAREAFADEFISRLPAGYETRVVEGGANFSGGERQRIALARAFLRNSPILILDEPTSAVDRESERKIVAALEKLMKNRTTILVSHRKESLAGCSQVFSLEAGSMRLLS